MKRTLIAIVAAVFAATGAQAVTIGIDTDQASYGVGDNVVITFTAVFDGTEGAGGAGTSFGLEVTWDSSIAHVANGDLGNGDFGSSSQLVNGGPEFQLTAVSSPSATAQTWVAVADPGCANDASTCAIASQLSPNIGADFFQTMDAQTLVGTLILEADDLGSLGLGFGAINFIGVTDPGVINVGTNFETAQVVPEPTTAALLGLGLLGLGIAGRRRQA